MSNTNGSPQADAAAPSIPTTAQINGTSPAASASSTPAQPAPATTTSDAGPSNAVKAEPDAGSSGPEPIAVDEEEGDKGKEKDEDKAESQLFATRREEEIARSDRSLAEFLVMLDGYKPLIPEEVTEYYLQRAGFECNDPRLKRLLSLSAQNFISDLSRDAFHFAKLRVSGTTAGRGRPSAGVDRNRVVLTMDDLSLALGEHGVNVKKPDYYL
ncbi:Transcription initiation factor TFIID subunit 10 [Vanrija pseudolonga]|uniref:Transcription initiation factor TFIID subunit 10 n=1 Tax=Vanrija pseudolonga TaxID=143232 RepID=A0AAF1BNV7_9TREE|nr:Transcription initiation factor TFIID subunit 10 [Vanrija pseudolonga]